MKKTVYTRAKLLTLIARSATVEDAQKFAGLHTSKRISRAITRRVQHLSTVPMKMSIPESERGRVAMIHAAAGNEAKFREVMSPNTRFVHDNGKPVDPEFQKLVLRFTAEGKPNPEKSARASIARKAQLAKKTAPSMAGGF